MSAPATSPSHQVNQVGPKSLARENPPSVSVATPIVALIAVATNPARPANVNTSRGRSNSCGPDATRRTSHAPTRHSRVLPVAMPIDVATVPAVVRFARNAPSQMPGHATYPSTRIAASAMPVGGHTGEALALTNARLNPYLAATK